MKYHHQFWNWVAGLLDIACGLVNTLTLAYYRPWWDMSFRCWVIRRNIKKGKEKK